MFGSAPFCSANINIYSCKMCSHHRSYQAYHSNTNKPVRILSKVLTSKLVNTLKLYPTKITHSSFSKVFLVFLLAFLCNSHYYQKRNSRHLVEHQYVVVVPRNIVTYHSFCLIGRNGSPGETAKQRNDPRR